MTRLPYVGNKTSRELTDTLERQKALDGPVEKVSQRLESLLSKSKRKQEILDFLHGVWLGHPLHPVLVSLPLGSWSAAAFFDLLSLGSSKTNPTATKAIAIGIVGAAVAAPAGLADWRTLNDRQRRVGIVHAALNTTALTAYTLSLLCRLLRIGPPRMLAFAGFGLTMASGYLGGELVYRLHAGVAQRPLAEPPKDFELALPSHELHEGEIRRIEIEGYPVMLTRQHGFIYALSDVCTHLACSLSEGHVEDQSIRCNCHGSRFSLADGAVINGPATVAETSFEVREYDSRIEVRLRRY